jgi:hypothetical protein
MSDLLEKVVALGKEFRRRGMLVHRKALADYYRELRAGQPGAWTPEMVTEWMQALQLPPHDKDLEVRQRSAGCAKCGAIVGVFTQRNFPGGWMACCARCEDRWLVLDTQDTRPAATDLHTETECAPDSKQPTPSSMTAKPSE